MRWDALFCIHILVLRFLQTECSIFLCVLFKQEPQCFHSPSSNLVFSRIEVRDSSRVLKLKFSGQHLSIPAAATRWQPDKSLSAIAAEIINCIVNFKKS